MHAKLFPESQSQCNKCGVSISNLQYTHFSHTFFAMLQTHDHIHLTQIQSERGGRVEPILLRIQKTRVNRISARRPPILPLKARMFVCGFILCLCSVCRYRPYEGLIPRPRSPTVCAEKITKLKKRRGPNKGL
jgi:hypothetical protein